MKNVTTFLEGKKTFICAAVMVVLSGLQAQGYISSGTYQTAMGLMGAFGLAALRLSVKNSK